MKALPTTALLVTLLAAPSLSGEKERQAELQGKYDKKITAKFVAHGGWLLDYDAARAKAN